MMKTPITTLQPDLEKWFRDQLDRIKMSYSTRPHAQGYRKPDMTAQESSTDGRE